MSGKNYIVAAYIRLSAEDVNNALLKKESNSIVNQRALIKNYIKESEELCTSEYLEFVDDGYTGTNFNRPQFDKMLDMARKGGINCIIVKDLSRLGRNHRETGDFLEHIFPFLGIRFISINDRYDSKNTKSTPGIDIAFKNLMNEFYAKDISKKLKKVKEIHAQKGMFSYTYPPYGYKKSPTNKYKFIIDEEAADVVREIFNMRNSGKSLIEIARKLNAENVLTPSSYIKAREGKSYTNNLWNGSMISHIIRNETYLGKMILNKTKYIYLSGHGTKAIKSDNPVITENAHDPIVTEEVFKAVSINRNYGKTKRKNIHLFTGKIKCKVCGYTLYANNKKNTGYECRMSKGYSERKCYSGIIEESYIEKTVKSMINKLIKKNEKANRLLEKPDQDKDYIQLIDSLEKKIERLKNKKFDLFEDYIRKDMSDDEYIERNTKLDLEISKIEEEIVLYKIQYDEYKEECKYYEELKSIKKLTREIIDKFIDVILVDANGKLEIKWKF